MTSTRLPPEAEAIRFGHLDISYDHRVLEPRPWTVAQSAWATDLLREVPAGPVLELCAGAGHIGLLAIADTLHHLVAVDSDPVACEFARQNAAAAGLADRVEVRNARISDALAEDERFRLVIADPPWVPSAHTSEFPADPLLAIDGGKDGLELARECAAVAATHLEPGGLMLLQLGTPAQVDVLALDLVTRHPHLVVEEVRRPHPTGVVAAVRRSAPGRVSVRTR